MIKPLHRKLPTATRCALMLAAPARDWNVFKQIFAEYWDGFTHAHPRYPTSYYDGLVAKMLALVAGGPSEPAISLMGLQSIAPEPYYVPLNGAPRQARLACHSRPPVFLRSTGFIPIRP
jgi:hypothetical protein